jgi:NAD(P)-dependent dehydrogenase (short-subunit alcohol dehydrogenase family)
MTAEPTATYVRDMTTWTPPTGPVAIIGAGPGLGAALARRFGRSGLSVGLVARGAERLTDQVQRLADLGVTAVGFPTDITHEPSLRLALDGIADRLGPPAVLICNASVHLPGTPSTVDPHDVLAGFLTGTLSAVIAVQQVVPAMKAAGGGTVLITGSSVAVKPAAGAVALTIQKAGVRAYALAAAKELAPLGIHAATVTIMGTMSQGTPFDPDLIAGEFWRLHEQPPGEWSAEFSYVGESG